MSLGITRRTLTNGGGDYMTKIRAPLPLYDIDVAKMEWPENYMGMYHPDDLASSTPIKCVRTNPNIMTFQAIACRPNDAWLQIYAPEKYAENEALKKLTVTTMPVNSGEIYRPGTGTVLELIDRNGEKVPIAVGEEGENLAPLVMLAGMAALLFYGG